MLNTIFTQNDTCKTILPTYLRGHDSFDVARCFDYVPWGFHQRFFGCHWQDFLRTTNRRYVKFLQHCPTMICIVFPGVLPVVVKGTVAPQGHTDPTISEY